MPDSDNRDPVPTPSATPSHRVPSHDPGPSRDDPVPVPPLLRRGRGHRDGVVTPSADHVRSVVWAPKASAAIGAFDHYAHTGRTHHGD